MMIGMEVAEGSEGVDVEALIGVAWVEEDLVDEGGEALVGVGAMEAEEEKSPWCSLLDPEDRVLTIVLGAEL